jgi:hypothetical protein
MWVILVKLIIYARSGSSAAVAALVLSSWPIWCQVNCWSRASWTASGSRLSVWARRLTRVTSYIRSDLHAMLNGQRSDRAEQIDGSVRARPTQW